MPKFHQAVQEYLEKKLLTKPVANLVTNFYHNFQVTTKTGGISPENLTSLFIQYLRYISRQINSPYPFPPYHEKLESPEDYSEFGLSFLRPLILTDQSKIYNEKILDQIEEKIQAKENVVLFANHQTEPDPQIIRLMLHPKHPSLADDMIFVAGHRVTTDPLATPLSMGCNLLNIYSKKYIDHPPEQRLEKQRHNQRTMRRMKEMLTEGGKCIFVAPSGGRDRPNKNNELSVAPFDHQSIEMFRLMALQAKTPTHFYPLALYTHTILPPPRDIGANVGEKRLPGRSPVFLWFGDEINMTTFPGSDCPDRKERRKLLTNYIFKMVEEEYAKFPIH